MLEFNSIFFLINYNNKANKCFVVFYNVISCFIGINKYTISEYIINHFQGNFFLFLGWFLMLCFLRKQISWISPIQYTIDSLKRWILPAVKYIY